MLCLGVDLGVTNIKAAPALRERCVMISPRYAFR